MLTAILVDDEYYALEGLKMKLEELGGIKVAGMFEDGKSAVENARELMPDIIFLDIDMPETGGLELFDELLECCPQAHIVFVTAYNEYAVEAFELNAADYILKPAGKERLEKTIRRLQKKDALPALTRLVSIDCFGHLSIKIDGKEAAISWRTKKTEEMLAYLACAKGNFIAKEKLAEILWPGLDIEKSKANFYLAYHYLKKQSDRLGAALPLESSRGKIRLRTEELELDIVRFQEELAGLQKITEDNIGRAEKGIGLYKGMLLDGHYYEWSTEMGQYYEILYKELLKKMAEYCREKGNAEKEGYYRKKSYGT